PQRVVDFDDGGSPRGDGRAHHFGRFLRSLLRHDDAHDDNEDDARHGDRHDEFDERESLSGTSAGGHSVKFPGLLRKVESITWRKPMPASRQRTTTTTNFPSGSPSPSAS